MVANVDALLQQDAERGGGGDEPLGPMPASVSPKVERVVQRAAISQETFTRSWISGETLAETTIRSR